MKLVNASFPVLFATLALSSPIAAQSLIVVDNAGNGDFELIQAAVDAASDGDVLRILSGRTKYSTFIIDNKSLTLIGEGSPSMTGGAVINLSSSRSVSIDGLSFSSELLIENNLGPVWLEDLDGLTQGFLFIPPPPFLSLVNNTAVSVTRCQIEGYPAINASASDVFVYDSVIKGSDGSEGSIAHNPIVPTQPCTEFDGGRGSDGISLNDSSFLFISNTIVEAGNGGDGGSCQSVLCSHCSDCTNAGDGGHGILIGPGSAAEHLGSTLIRGRAGNIAAGCAGGQDGGFASLIFPGTITELPGDSVSFEASSLTQVGANLSLKFTGEPLGHLVYLQVATEQNPLFFPAWQGAWLIDQAAPLFYMGFIPASGELERSPLLKPLGIPLINLYGQGIFVDFPGGITTLQLSSPSLMVLFE